MKTKLPNNNVFGTMTRGRIVVIAVHLTLNVNRLCISKTDISGWIYFIISFCIWEKIISV